MNNFKEDLEKTLNKERCPNCNSENIGIDNWGMFDGEDDWFYYCKECDETFKKQLKREKEMKYENIYSWKDNRIKQL